jgi:hypothetical protein
MPILWLESPIIAAPLSNFFCSSLLRLFNVNTFYIISSSFFEINAVYYCTCAVILLFDLSLMSKVDLTFFIETDLSNWLWTWFGFYKSCLSIDDIVLLSFVIDSECYCLKSFPYLAGRLSFPFESEFKSTTSFRPNCSIVRMMYRYSIW